MNNDNLPELPKGWVWVTLGDLIDFVKGKKPKNLGVKNENRNIAYINIEAFENKVFNQFTDGVGCELCTHADILIVWDGARCGLVGKGVSGAVGSTLAKLIYYELNQNYLFYFLRTKYELINKHPRGVGIPHVEPNIFWNIQFPLPPLPEQQRIVAKIEELFTNLDAGIEALKKVKEQVKRYRQAVLKYAFEGKLTEEWRNANKDKIEDASVLLEKIKKERKEKLGKKYKELPPVDTSELPELPEGWVWVRLGEISLIETGNPAPQGKEFFENGIYPFVRVQDMGRLGNSKYINYTFDKLNRLSIEKLKLYPKGSILFTKSGMSLYLNQRAILGKDMYVVSHIGVAIPIGEIPSEIIYYWLKLFDFQKLAHATTLPSIKLSKIMEIPFPLPPLPEQLKIIEEIERRFSIADEIEKVIENNLKQAERLRQSILNKAFEGKLVPQDPTDEPAEKLLERIRELKAKQAQSKGSVRKSRRI